MPATSRHASKAFETEISGLGGLEPQTTKATSSTTCEMRLASHTNYVSVRVVEVRSHSNGPTFPNSSPRGFCHGLRWLASSHLAPKIGWITWSRSSSPSGLPPSPPTPLPSPSSTHAGSRAASPHTLIRTFAMPFERSAVYNRHRFEYPAKEGCWRPWSSCRRTTNGGER